MAVKTVLLLALFGSLLSSFCQGAATKPVSSLSQNAVYGVSDTDDQSNDDATEYVFDGDDDDDDDSDVLGEVEEVGERVDFNVEDLNDEELQLYMDLEEQVFLAEANEHLTMKMIKEKRALYTGTGSQVRRKRVAPIVGRLAFTAGRALLKRFSRTGAPTRSGSRVTQHYSTRGNYQDAVRDFNSLRPDNVRSFSGRISGQTGRMGNHKVTVRDGSSGSNSRPTLEIRSHGGDFVRKGRYNP